MKKSDFIRLLFVVLVWRLTLQIIIYFSISTLPLQLNFLGGGRENYLNNPYLWSWLNFDGEHYLSIAQFGYKPLTYFFFPFYPILIGAISSKLSLDLAGTALTGLVIANLLFTIALVGLYKIILLDYKPQVYWMTVFLLLLFPTSFYFGSFYTESSFLTLSIWTIYFARTAKWTKMGIAGAFATAARFVGIALIPAALLEGVIKLRFNKFRHYFPFVIGTILIFTGILAYTFYLEKETGDPLIFFHEIAIFGEQRSTNFILLPQVFYRYIFKILPNVNYNFFPAVFTTLLEFVTAIVFLLLIVVSFLKQRISYVSYSVIAYLIPTLAGSFSSLPRYVLIIFPLFILSATFIVKWPKVLQCTFFAVLFICLWYATSLFVRGYWVS